MNKYKNYREIAEIADIAKKAHENIDQAMDNINCAMSPDEDSYYDSILGKAECAMRVNISILAACISLKELEDEWAKVVKKLCKEYEDAWWG